MLFLESTANVNVQIINSITQIVCWQVDVIATVY